MSAPLVCFVTWNRAGLVARNLTALLKTTDDFELYIIDSNSTDGTWQFIEGLKDDRIICKKRWDRNRGYVFAGNYALSKRKKDQYFITIDSDACIKTDGWVKKFMSAMDAFPDVGLLGLMPNLQVVLDWWKWPYQIINNGDLSYYQLHSDVWGGCMCLRPELIELIGYFNEETGRADYDLWSRVDKFTPFKMGYINTIDIDSIQKISCEECIIKNKCPLYDTGITCFDIHKKGYKHVELVQTMEYRHNEFMKEIADGKRSVYCASLHDPKSIATHYYNKKWACEINDFFIKKSN